MYLWAPIDDAFEGPYRDGDFDATIIQHEYSHGLSNRYVGGGGLGSLGSVQAGSMGEGWGDWYAMNDLFRRGLTKVASTAPYVGVLSRGIRNWNYASHPTTYGDIGYDVGGPEVHSDGEIWTATLWQLRSAILTKVGGNQAKASDIAEHIVTDAMPISPPAPSMLDMRDAILKASELRYKATYTDLLWSVFAQRGMGASAKTKGETDTDPKPGFDHKVATRNGTLAVKLVNPSAGNPIKGARIMVGQFEARVSPFLTTTKAGAAQGRMVPGRYTLTIAADGYGIQRFPVTIERGQVTRKTIQLRPSLVSPEAGARIVKVTSQDDTMPGSFLLDASEASTWRTGPSATSYNQGPDQSVSVRLAKKSLVQTVGVSVMKPPSLPRFAAANKVLVQTSLDGKTWKTVTTATFSWAAPRPTVADQKLKLYNLPKPVYAKFVRAVAASVYGDTAETASQALVAHLGVYGKVSGIRPTPVPPDAPVTESGEVAVGNIAQGLLLLPGTEPYRDGVTTASWKATCPDVPAANGADAWITKLPAGSADGRHAITYKGDVPIGEWLLYWYDATCTPLAGDFGYVDTTVTVPPRAAYAGFLLLYGGAATFDVTVSEPR